MRIANMILSMVVLFVVGFQSVLIYVGGSLADENSLVLGAGAGIIMAMALLFSTALSLERPYSASNALNIFGVFGLLAGFFTPFIDLLIYGIIVLIWNYFFRNSINQEGV